MLLRFNVKNFLSFDNDTEFSMFSGKTRLKDNHLIKTKKTKRNTAAKTINALLSNARFKRER